MARVTANDVKLILETELTFDQLTPFIVAANLMVTNHCAPLGYSASQLKVIEQFLAAHFATVRERQKKSESIGDASDSYMGQDGLGLDSSLYGQQVQILDSKKGLQSTKMKPMRIGWLGTDRLL